MTWQDDDRASQTSLDLPLDVLGRRLALVIRLALGGNMPPIRDARDAWFDPKDLAQVVADYVDLEPFQHLRSRLAGKDHQRVQRLVARAIGGWLPEDPDELPEGLSLREQEVALVLRLSANTADGIQEPLDALSVSPIRGYNGELWRPRPDTARRWRTKASTTIAVHLLDNPPAPQATTAEVRNATAEVPSTTTNVALPPLYLDLPTAVDVHAQPSGVGDQTVESRHRRFDSLPRLDENRLAVRTLGVHRAIDLPNRPGQDGLDPDLPTWVERDLARMVRGWLARAKEEGGFLVVAGDSSVGKTRLLYETALDVLHGWPILVPAVGDGDPVNDLASTAEELPEGTVIWLDELYRLLSGPGRSAGSTPVVADAISRLLDAPTPVVILGSIWPEHLEIIASTKEGPNETIEHAYPEAADTLRLGRIVILKSFNDAEASAAAIAAVDDPRLATAIRDPNFGVTQALAGAPALVERYETARGERQALLFAAIDAQRLGVVPPLSDDLLAHCARGYLSGIHPAEDWIQPALQALSRIGGPDDRATAPLVPIPSPDRRYVVGYEVADYLLQYGSHDRREAHVPDTLWDGLVSYVQDPTVLADAAIRAENRGLDSQTERLNRRAAHLGDEKAASWLARRLESRGELDELRLLAASHEHSRAPEILAGALASRNKVDELEALAHAGNQRAASKLARALASRNKVDELEALADSGEREAAAQLAAVLLRRGDIERVRARMKSGDAAAADALVSYFNLREDPAELQALVDAGHPEAGLYLTIIQVRQGDLDAVRVRAQAGDAWAAAEMRARNIATTDDVDELRGWANLGDPLAARRLKLFLYLQSSVNELRGSADKGDYWANEVLVVMLAKDGKIDELRTRANSGDSSAETLLNLLLARQGDVEELRARATRGDSHAAAELNKLLAKRGDLNELRERSDQGDTTAARQLVSTLALQGDLDGLRREVAAGTLGAMDKLRHIEASDGG